MGNISGTIIDISEGYFDNLDYSGFFSGEIKHLFDYYIAFTLKTDTGKEKNFVLSNPIGMIDIGDHVEVWTQKRFFGLLELSDENFTYASAVIKSEHTGKHLLLVDESYAVVSSYEGIDINDKVKASHFYKYYEKLTRKSHIEGIPKYRNFYKLESDQIIYFESDIRFMDEPHRIKGYSHKIISFKGDKNIKGIPVLEKPQISIDGTNFINLNELLNKNTEFQLEYIKSIFPISILGNRIDMSNITFDDYKEFIHLFFPKTVEYLINFIRKNEKISIGLGFFSFDNVKKKGTFNELKESIVRAFNKTRWVYIKGNDIAEKTAGKNILFEYPEFTGFLINNQYILLPEPGSIKNLTILNKGIRYLPDRVIVNKVGKNIYFMKSKSESRYKATLDKVNIENIEKILKINSALPFYPYYKSYKDRIKPAFLLRKTFYYFIENRELYKKIRDEAFRNLEKVMTGKTTKDNPIKQFLDKYVYVEDLKKFAEFSKKLQDALIKFNPLIQGIIHIDVGYIKRKRFFNIYEEIYFHTLGLDYLWFSLTSELGKLTGNYLDFTSIYLCSIDANYQGENASIIIEDTLYKLLNENQEEKEFYNINIEETGWKTYKISRYGSFF